MNVRQILTGLAVALLIVSCKPQGQDSELQSITGINENGKRAAFALLPVRNAFTVPMAGGSRDAGAKQAEALVLTRLFAMIECVEGNGANEEQMVEWLEERAAADDLYLTAKRQIITSPEGELRRYGKKTPDGKHVIVPCRVHGDRLLTWDVVADVQTRALSLERKTPKGKHEIAAAKRIYLLNQSLVLAVRGSYDPDDPKVKNGKLDAMVEMGEQHRGEIVSRQVLGKRMLASDRYYNPCVKKSVNSFIDAEKTRNFACIKMAGSDNLFNYRAGGASGNRYVEVRDLLALEISRTHDLLQRSNAGDIDLARLWNVTTTARPLGNVSGASREIAQYLATGQGFKFSQRFASANAKYVQGSAINPADLASVPADFKSGLAPLLNAKVNKLRIRPLYRAASN